MKCYKWQDVVVVRGKLELCVSVNVNEVQMQEKLFYYLFLFIYYFILFFKLIVLLHM